MIDFMRGYGSILIFFGPKSLHPSYFHFCYIQSYRVAVEQANNVESSLPTVKTLVTY